MPPRILVPLVGEPLPLDLANTRPAVFREDRGVDQFVSVGGLAEWLLAESDRLPVVPVTEPMRRAVVRLRGHVGALLDAIVVGERPGEHDVGKLNAALAAAPGVPRLDWTDAGPRLDTVRQGGAEGRLLTALAESAAEYLVSDLAGRTRRCEAPDCEVLFASTNARRRWCSPERVRQPDPGRALLRKAPGVTNSSGAGAIECAVNTDSVSPCRNRGGRRPTGRSTRPADRSTESPADPGSSARWWLASLARW